ncbi:MAG: hypothetical protein HRU01_07765 [Myxococcales bacterium]|nr:hypothetical protein [Myxococcales bacterium]
MVQNLGRRSVAVLLFALAFFATVRLVGSFRATSSLVEAKLGQIVRDAADIDVIFLGNSRAYRHVDPETFDRHTADAGHPTRSYNLGAPDMSFAELDYVVRTLETLGLENLRWVFIDLTTSWRVDPRNLGSRRVIAWHDLRSSLIALSLAADGEAAGSEAAPAEGTDAESPAARHVSNFFVRLTGAGYGRDATEYLLEGGAYDDPLAGHVRGFLPLTADSVGAERRHARFLSNASAYRMRIERLKHSARVVGSPGPRQEALLERLIGEATEAGIRVVLYMPPVASRTLWMSERRPDSPDYLYFAFNDPNDYPEFFRVSDRFDPQHLNASAARRFSKTLALRFAAALH